LRSSKILRQEQSKSVVHVEHSGKKLFFHFKCYNLTIRAVNFCKTFCTCSFSSLGQDPKVESEKK
jgi:hypothetical protein